MALDVNKMTKDQLKQHILMLAMQLTQLEEENKKLKEKIEHLEFDIEAWKGLKAVWEKKEQELQRENEKLNLHIEAKDKAYMDLLADYNYLKARIKKTERAFIKYKEKLEKLEVDLDMVVMNR